VTAEHCALNVREHGFIITHDTRERIDTSLHAVNEVMAHFLFERLCNIIALAQFAECFYRGLFFHVVGLKAFFAIAFIITQDAIAKRVESGIECFAAIGSRKVFNELS
jgi:hypothetical protein